MASALRTTARIQEVARSVRARIAVPRSPRSEGYVLESATHLLDVLVFIGSHEGDHSISGVSRGLGLTFSRAYRLIATLEAKGFVERDPATKRYRIGPRAFEVGMRYRSDRALIAEARRQLERLVADSRETAFLAVRDGAEAVYIDRVDSPQAIRFQTAIGSRAPWHCVAAGRALVCQERAEVVAELLRAPLVRCGDTTLTRAQVERELALARELGYAVNIGQWHEDVAAVASPVLDADGRPVAALVLGGPKARFSRQRTVELGRLVRDRARSLLIG